MDGDVVMDMFFFAREGEAAKLEHAIKARGLKELATAKAWDMSLSQAASNGHEECVRLLVEHGDPGALRSFALRCAACAGHRGCVALLLPASDPLAKDERSGMDAAMLARSRGRQEVARMIEAFVEAMELEGAAPSRPRKGARPL